MGTQAERREWEATAGATPARSRCHGSLSPALLPQTTRRQNGVCRLEDQARATARAGARGLGTSRLRAGENGLPSSRVSATTARCPRGRFQRSHTCSDLSPRHAEA